jgi:hypothetical protein
MSDVTAVFAMLGTYLAMYLIGMYVTKMANDRMDEILIGVVQGLAVSEKHRSMMLYNQWLPLMSGLAAGSMVLAVGYLQVAPLVAGDGARLLAHLLAALSGWSFFMFLFLGASTGLQCMSVLRQVKRN